MENSFETLGELFEVSRRTYAGREVLGYRVASASSAPPKPLHRQLPSSRGPGATALPRASAPLDPTTSTRSRATSSAGAEATARRTTTATRRVPTTSKESNTKEGVWRWIRYRDLGILVDRAEAGLRGRGIRKGDKVALLSRNRLEWVTVAFAVYRMGAVLVPVYEEQPSSDWESILEETGAKIAFVSGGTQFLTVQSMKQRLPDLQHVVGFDLGPDQGPHAEHAYTHLMRSGAATLVEGLMEAASAPPSGDGSRGSAPSRNGPGSRPVLPKEPVRPDDLAAIVYTSGTTGSPKGVRLTHQNICSNVRSALEHFSFVPEDRSLAVLPWAHALGQTCELYSLLAAGASLAINDDPARFEDNVAAVRPTVLVCAPTIFNRLYARVQEEVADKPAPVQTLFASALELCRKQNEGQRLNLLDRGVLAAADRAIFEPAREQFGGRLRFAMVGSSGLSRRVAELIDALGIEVFEGYGLTETGFLVTANRSDDCRLGSVGKPIFGVAITIDREAVPPSNSERSRSALQGEIVVKGPGVTPGYHNRPAETEQVLQSDGSLRTGDLGFVDAEGFLYVTGRKADQFELETGRRVVPEPLEEELRLSPYIAQVMLYGAGKPHTVALVALDVPWVRRWLSGIGRMMRAWEDADEQQKTRRAHSSGVRKVWPAAQVAHEKRRVMGMEIDVSGGPLGPSGPTERTGELPESERVGGRHGSGTHRTVEAPVPPGARPTGQGAPAAISDGALCESEEVQNLIWEEIEKYSVDFRGFERPNEVVLVADEFTMENGLLTPKRSLKRPTVCKKYATLLEALYDTSGVKN